MRARRSWARGFVGGLVVAAIAACGDGRAPTIEDDPAGAGGAGGGAGSAGAGGSAGRDAGGNDASGSDAQVDAAAQDGGTSTGPVVDRGCAAPAAAPNRGLLRVAVVGPAAVVTDVATHLSAMLAKTPALPGATALSVPSDQTYDAALASFYFTTTGRDARLAALAAPVTHVVLVEDASVADASPELWFEGARELACLARSTGATPVVVTPWANAPASDAARTESTYRIANGLGAPAIPAGAAWTSAKAAGALAGDAPFVAASAIYEALAHATAASTNYAPAGTPVARAKKLSAATASALGAEAARSHYAGAFVGPVVVASWVKTPAMRFMDSGTSSEAIWESRMNDILPKIGVSPMPTAIGACNAMKSFDTTCLATAEQQFKNGQYAILIARDYTVDGGDIQRGGAQTDLQVQVWDRHEDNLPSDGAAAVDVMAQLSLSKAAEARALHLAWVPYHVMFSKLKTQRPTISLTSDGTHATYPVGYGLATMSVVSRTGVTPPDTGLDADTTLAARLADETVRQLSSLSVTGTSITDDPATRPSLP